MGLISNGTTLLDAGATSSGVFSGTMILLSTTTASSSATIDITSGINSTYKEYQIHFFDVHPQSGSRLGFQADVGTATNYALQRLSCGGTVETDADASATGILTLYDPANTTFLKHFMSTMQIYNNDQSSHNSYVAGYINTTTAITRVQFKFNSGNIDSGIIKMYGIT